MDSKLAPVLNPCTGPLRGDPLESPQGSLFLWKMSSAVKAVTVYKNTDREWNVGMQVTPVYGSERRNWPLG